MFSEEHLYSIALRSCNLIGDANFKKLIDTFGSAETVWHLPQKELSTIFGFGDKKIKEIGNSDRLKFAENELNFCDNNNIKINLRHKNELPNLLQQCEDAPSILYQKGKYNADLQPISIVGTRNMTNYGKTFINDFLKEIKEKNVQTISGLALGVDTEVHQKSLEINIPTVAVLAHGFHTIYPSKNKKLSETILENNGTLFTEFNSSQKPDREHFIQRNRIVAGLSLNLIVVETAYKGGSISTATFANGYNRNVYALPGKSTDQYSQGCNLIISQHKAGIIVNEKHLAKELNLEKNTQKIGELFPKKKPKPHLSTEQELLYNIIEQYPAISLDELSIKSKIPTFQLLPILLDLEILGCIRTLSGRQFYIE